MKRYLSVLFAIALLGTVSLTASAQVNVTIKPFGGLGGNFGNMATEIGYAVAPNLELVGGIDHGSVTVKTEVKGQSDSETIGVTLFNVGGRYYFMKNGNLDRDETTLATAGIGVNAVGDRAALRGGFLLRRPIRLHTRAVRSPSYYCAGQGLGLRSVHLSC